MNPAHGVHEERALIVREARLLDEKRWDDWLELYVEDARYWVPARTANGDLTTDPNSELSLIYYDRRYSLQERIMRIRSGRSLASTPLQRTVHILGDLSADDADSPGLYAAPFTVQIFEPRTKRCFSVFGHYQFQFRQTAAGLRIAMKKIILANDHLEAILDIYSL
ncbi:MAG: aromatic-ring-hydroxylating dioxygenase subunit beta [Burkholderiaceae bacterium]|nr:aromatic-ring-hydroxylating dioxygenase subunit beta [Burkholderiaceae bacterium]